MTTKVAPDYTSRKAAPETNNNGLLNQLWPSLAVTVVLAVICCGLYPLLVWAVAQLAFPMQANGSLIKKDGTLTTHVELAVGSALIGQNFGTSGYFHPRPSAAGNGYDPTSSGGSNYGPLSDKLLNGATATQPAPTPPATTETASASAPAATSAGTQAAASQPATQPVETLAYDGLRLRVLHYAADNNIAFKFYYITCDKNNNVLSTSPVPTADLPKFQDKDGNLNDLTLVDNFPHPTSADDPADKTYQYVIAADFATPIPADAVTASASGLDPHISPDNAHLQAPRVAHARGIPVDRVKQLVTQYTEGPSLGLLGEAGVNVLRLNLALDNEAPLPAGSPASATAPATAPAPATSPH
jgi:K+-transporting ATPase ATPase C chain